MEIKDNYKEIKEAVYQYVLDYLPTLNLNVDDNVYLYSEIKRLETYLEFRKAGTNITLSIDFDRPHDKNWLPIKETDSDGNDFIEYKLNVQLNWPCHGTTDINIATERFDFYKEIALLGGIIMNKFGHDKILQLYYTAAEKKEQEEKAKKAKQAAVVDKLVIAHNKGMRVGNTKDIFVSNLHNLVDIGDYTVMTNNKEFTASVTITDLCFITRKK